jgi:hypothetical protein
MHERPMPSKDGYSDELDLLGTRHPVDVAAVTNILFKIRRHVGNDA